MAVLLGPPSAEADGARPSPSRSIGRTNGGRLENAVELHPSSHIRLKEGAVLRFGTAELVALIERAAERVAERFPGSVLLVGDLSAPEGRAFPPHHSHQSGRDVDIGFYLLDGEDRPVVAPHMIRVRADRPVQRGDAWYRFDVDRCWELVAALAMDDEVPVQHIFVAYPLRQALLRHAEEIDAPADVRERVETLLRQPTDGGAHRSHFHVRIYCPPDDDECVDEPPYHPWLRHRAPEAETAD